MSSGHVEDIVAGTMALLVGCLCVGFVMREIQVSRGKTLAHEALVLIGTGFWSLSFLCMGTLFLLNLLKDGTATLPMRVRGLGPILVAVMIVTLAGGFGVLMVWVIRSEIENQRSTHRDE